MSAPGSRAQVSVGHWTDQRQRTGCTTILFDRLVPAVVDVRGGAPGTRETDLLGPAQSVGKVDAIFLTGGSAHGLGAADGVMQYLREQQRGYPTVAGNVPIVSGAVIYDLAVGESIWPAAADAYASCHALTPFTASLSGPIGVGTGATYRKAWPGLAPLDGGIGCAVIDVPDLGTVKVLLVVNAVGDFNHPNSDIDSRISLLGDPSELNERSATTLIVVIIDGNADPRTLRRCAIAAHDGLARMIRPAHTQFDGDLVYVALLGDMVDTLSRDAFRWAVASELAVESAIRAAVGKRL